MRYIITLRSTFLADSEGNVAIIAALTFVALVGSVGVAVDYSRSQNDRTTLQAAIDAATLAVANEYIRTEDKNSATKIGKKFFDYNIAKSVGVHFSQPEFQIDDIGTAKGTLTSITKTTISGILNISNIKHKIEATAKARKNNIEIVLVLDVSSSMEEIINGKAFLEHMQDAANNFITYLDTKANISVIKFAVVPFAQTVNIGSSNTSFVIGSEHELFASQSWDGCVFERPSPYHVSDNYDGGSWSAQGKWHAYIAPPEPDAHNSTSDPHYCLNPSNGTNTGYGSQTSWLDPYMLDRGDSINGPNSPWKRGPNFNCTQHSILPLTDNLSTVRSKIDSLTSSFNLGTIIAPGIAWGRRVLSPQEPFTEGSEIGRPVKRVMIVLTDGEQRTNGESWEDYSECDNYEHSSGSSFDFDPAKFKLGGKKLFGNGPTSLITPYGYILDSDPFGSTISNFSDEARELDRISRQACDEAKNASVDDVEVEIYTIGISKNSGPGTIVHDLMEYCASDADKFYHVDQAGGLDDVFADIGAKLGTVFLSK